MKSLSKTRLSFILMLVGLIALAVFEIIWLQSEYKRQLHVLQMEQVDFFHTSIRTIEDSLLQVMVINPLDVADDSLEFLSAKGSRVLFQRQDTSRTMTIVRSLRIHPDDEDDNNVRDEKHHHDMRYQPRRSLMLGMLSKTLAEQGDSTHSKSIAALIQHQLDQNTTYAPSIPYQLVTYNDPDTVFRSGVASAPYYDIWSGEYYTLLYPRYAWYLFKKIIPQLLFCLVLLGVISAAFYFIHKNLAQERQLAELRREFLSNITHELKTPIATVRVALEAITNFNAASTPERATEYIDISKGELDRLSMLVDKVLQLSQFEENNAEFRYESVDFKEIVNRTLASMKVQFQQRHAHVSFDLVGDDFTMDADKLHMTGVVYNLLDNALKYSTENPEVNVTLSQDNGSMVLQVSDKGRGISKENHARIFEKFYRVPSGGTHDVKGHGLGLSYVSHVVKAHNGSIALESESGTGTSFIVTLPKHHVN